MIGNLCVENKDFKGRLKQKGMESGGDELELAWVENPQELLEKVYFDPPGIQPLKNLI